MTIQTNLLIGNSFEATAEFTVLGSAVDIVQSS